MHVISLAVIFYQILIATIIIVSASKSKKALFIAFILTSLWTLTHVFYPPLMVVQFITIISSSIYGYKRANSRYGLTYKTML